MESGFSPSGCFGCRYVTLADIAKHNSASSCYTTVSGGVYDLTSFINQHRGGSQAILSLCGIDGTAKFMAQHGGQGRPEQELASLRIGTLAK
jgi:cytochrome b involved in lipid metabolism